MNKSDKNLVKSASKNTVEALVSSLPPLAVAWGLAKALYGNALELRQQKALEFVESIINNPSIFTKQLLESAEFQDGFVVALEDYIKLRLVLKRGIARKIFISFAKSEDKEHFALERLNSTLRTVTAEGIEFLRFIETTLVPIQESETQKSMERIDKASAGYGNERLYELAVRHHPLSAIFDRWLTTNNKQDRQIMLSNVVDPKKPNIRSSTGYMLSGDEKRQYEEAITELQSLGVLKGHSYTVTSDHGINETRKYWEYTYFGKAFTAMLESNDQ